MDKLISSIQQFLDYETFILVTTILCNIICVVGIVILNKYITHTDGFNFMVFLTFLHFFITSIGLIFMRYLDFFPNPKTTMIQAFPVSVSQVFAVAFMNLNLEYNSVGLYQLSKIACIPVLLLIQYLAYKQNFSNLVLISLIPVIGGVAYATVEDVDVNVIGSIFAASAVLFSSLSQIFTNTYQKSLDCNPLQLLYITAPIICIGMLLLSFVFDDIPNLFTFVQNKLTIACLIRIIISCIFALGVNVSSYSILCLTSPLTYQVLGHAKTILIIVLGYYFFNNSVDLHEVLGMSVALFGVIFYTEVRRNEALNQAVIDKSDLTKPDVENEETDKTPLIQLKERA